MLFLVFYFSHFNLSRKSKRIAVICICYYVSSKDACKHLLLYVVCQGEIKSYLTLSITGKIVDVLLHVPHVSKNLACKVMT